MGFFKDIGKAITGAVGGAIKTVGTVLNPSNLVSTVTNLATGNLAGVVSNIGGTALSNVLGGAVNGYNGNPKPAPAPAPAPVKVANAGVIKSAGTAASLVKSNANAQTLRTGVINTGNATLDNVLNSALGGAAVGAGVAIGGTQAGNAAANATGWTAAKTWLKNNWIVVTVGAILAGVGAYFAFFRDGKGRKRYA